MLTIIVGNSTCVLTFQLDNAGFWSTAASAEASTHFAIIVFQPDEKY